MRDPVHRTKVVLRHLPPSISRPAVMEQIDARFADRYDWACFRPGKSSQKNQRYSRVYLNFKMPEDVVEFADFFNGHTFVNEKGAQFKALVEYAPSQQVPKSFGKRDGRVGTIVKDPEYLEFLELIAKPVEHLPSAEIQLERKEAERAAAGKEAPIVTPLMVYVRQQRAAKSIAQRSGGSRMSRKAAGILSGSSSLSKRGSEKRRISTSTYVLRDSSKDGNFKEKPTYILVPRRDDQTLRGKATAGAASSGTGATESEINASSGGTSGSSQAIEVSKDKIVLLKGRARVDSQLSDGASQQQTATSVKHMLTSASKQDHRLEASGRIIKTILSNKEARHVVASQPEQETQIINLEKDKRPPRPPNLRLILKDQILDSASKGRFDEKQMSNHLQGSVSVSEKIERHARNRDRPDRGVWAPRRSDRSTSGGGAQTSSSEPQLIQSHSAENFSPSQQVDGHGERKIDILTARREDTRGHGGVRGTTVENGSHRHVNRRGLTRGLKETEGSVSTSDVKPPKRGSTGYGSHERQVWVQKSGSGS